MAEDENVTPNDAPEETAAEETASEEPTPEDAASHEPRAEGMTSPETTAEETTSESPGAEGMTARGPTADELRAALDRVGVADVLVEALTAAVSLGFGRVSAEARDLPQARLAIESLRALEPVLREGGVDEGLVRDLEQARTNLQLAYAKAVGEEQSGR